MKRGQASAQGGCERLRALWEQSMGVSWLFRRVVDRYGYRFFVCIPLAGLFTSWFVYAFTENFPVMATTPWAVGAVYMARIAFIPRKFAPVRIRAGELTRLQALTRRMEAATGRRVNGFEALRGCLTLAEGTTDVALRDAVDGLSPHQR